MKIFFDTSALIPVFLEDHEHHERSLEAFVAADKKHSCCAAHTLAEIYSTLTRLPGRHRLSGDQVMLFLGNIRERLTLVSFDAEEYWTAIARAAETGIVGGALYDALLASCALKARVETIYTWNVRHFQALGPEISRRARTP
ncbi:MAG TPA: PIN domain-containing protein [Terriglobia bacterium]|nr:PIN domain-containing protein [Terriglobia bacterium]